jgi:hypothetical protein
MLKIQLEHPARQGLSTGASHSTLIGLTPISAVGLLEWEVFSLVDVGCKFRVWKNVFETESGLGAGAFFVWEDAQA